MLTIVADTVRPPRHARRRLRARATRCATRSTSAHARLPRQLPAGDRRARPRDQTRHHRNINFFMNVPVTPDGALTFDDGISAPGKYVEMRAEMDVMALISNCPQLNNPCNAYNPTPDRVLIWRPGKAKPMFAKF